ncbi:unnamed protein product [Caenorhabditis sp. 36 PRJEB53466]|nr:unnamed protein product [Caenorhabditis sp. 36 PRJEB53466]
MSSSNMTRMFGGDGCSQEYNAVVENLKYIGQVCYFLPAAIVHLRILAILLHFHRKIYMVQSFFVLFSMDSIASLTQVLFDVGFSRVFMYIPQVCPILYGYFERHTAFPHFQFTLYNYMRAAKSVIQVFMTLNRMTCVLMLLEYGQVRSLEPLVA